MFKFSIHKKDSHSKARVGELVTPHGVIKTPAFVPVGTKATVKGLTPQDLKECGVELLFGNTYHLHLRPGEDTVKELGGLAKFMGWNGPTITDSGGFQVFSLGKKNVIFRPWAEESRDPSVATLPQDDILVKITDDGVKFRSHIDGSPHMFTPEKSIEIQKKLGADIILAFDECTPYPSTYVYTKEAMERTYKWALRSLDYHQRHSGDSERSVEDSRIDSGQARMTKKSSQALYGIVQGGVFKDLREESAKFISQLPFDGISIGGVSVGESKKEMRDVLSWTSKFLPEEKPRHLLGIGEIDDIFEAVEWGIDTFDCVIPTRFGRYGIAFVPPPEGTLKNKFRLLLNKVSHAKDQEPIAKDCLCYTCKNFTRAYIHHLFRSEELLAYRLVSYHNVFFITHLVKQIREAIIDGSFVDLKKHWMRE